MNAEEIVIAVLNDELQHELSSGDLMSVFQALAIAIEALEELQINPRNLQASDALKKIRGQNE